MLRQPDLPFQKANAHSQRWYDHCDSHFYPAIVFFPPSVPQYHTNWLIFCFCFCLVQLSDRNLTSIDYDQSGADGNNLFKNDDHLTAFGLALMQNGFQPHSAILNSHTFQQINKQQQLTNSTPSTANLNNGLGSGANTNSINHPNATGVESVEQKWTPQNQTDDLNAWNVKSSSYQNTQKPFKWVLFRPFSEFLSQFSLSSHCYPNF